ncbi:abortive infection system antitoxin AbiGi family protein [Saccharospirillum sp. HFRX-1]|uniref:abortive infection system antitoxin AbiGi family protein n=1 Tax=unclassified Saccharospirillum TaxID=2633430 RepID=UPI00371D22E4
MAIKSHTLFHFTSSLDTLLSILRTGFWPRYCTEDFRWYNQELGYVSYPIVSFCDIPLTQINEHTDFYGKFGLGISREMAISAGINPVIYLTENSALRYSLLQLAQPKKFVFPPNIDLYSDYFLEVLSLIKPISGKMSRANGEEIEKDFCLESEWRYSPNLPKNRKCISMNKHNIENEDLNGYTYDNCMLKFPISAVNYLIVERNEDAVELANNLSSAVVNSKSSKDDIDYLKLRIITLEDIARDF